MGLWRRLSLHTVALYISKEPGVNLAVQAAMAWKEAARRKVLEIEGHVCLWLWLSF